MIKIYKVLFPWTSWIVLILIQVEPDFTGIVRLTKLFIPFQAIVQHCSCDTEDALMFISKNDLMELSSTAQVRNDGRTISEKFKS